MMYLCAEEQYARLPAPTIIKPNHYEISLIISNITKFEFEGDVTILIEVSGKYNVVKSICFSHSLCPSEFGYYYGNFFKIFVC